MNRLEFTDISFEDKQDKVRVFFQENYYFDIDKSDLESIARFSFGKEYIEFDCSEKKATNKLNRLIRNNLVHLTNKITKRKTIYITRNLGVPLIGNNAFGIVDRNTSLIEVKPVTGCNLNCVFCSVDEGPKGKWERDFLVEPNYLAQEFKKLAEYKNCNVEAHIGVHGEPLLYPKLVQLIELLSSIENVKEITMDTNGTLLSKKLIDDLKKAGLTRIQLSLNALDKNVACKLAGSAYNLDKVLDIVKYCKEKIEVLIAPIWVPGYNDKELEKLIKLSKKLGLNIAIQNFLSYKQGRNPVKQKSWKEFNNKLKQLENKHNVKLLYDAEDFEIHKTKKLSKPFKKGDFVKAKVVCDGRLANQKIAVANNRNITVNNCNKKGIVKVKIIRDKHNIFFGV
ncbi:MAG: Coenzyme PQQ synthesis protein E [Candidatus Woesearchaeota archaeon]|nr:Coenzyme PQQ synthesis protein E [Candidatus Woesearchaeota archaeon]